MEEQLKCFINNDCLICEDSHLFSQLINTFDLDIIHFKQAHSFIPKIIVTEREPVRFLAAFLAACRANCPVFLCNPDWGKQEWLQVFDLIKPDIIWGVVEASYSLDNSYSLENNFYSLENNSCSLNNSTNKKAGKMSTLQIDNPNTNSLLPIPNSPLPITNSPFSHIMIPTGGSSGKIKFAVHTWDTLTASVRGFQEYFQVDKINAFCVLPLYHVSGLMQFIRCFLTGGKLVILPFKTLETGEADDNDIKNLINGVTESGYEFKFREIGVKHIYSNSSSRTNKFNISTQECLINHLNFFISLVPTQLERLLQKSDLIQWLSKFKTVLLGGAPAWNELLEKARFHHIRLAPTYGMTETASQIATLKPDDFLKGKVGCGKVLPHAKVQIVNEKGEVLKFNQVGKINIKTESLALGYYPLNGEIQTYLQIDDLAFLDKQSYLNIVGRNSDKIITGGEKVYPAEVEAAIRATGMVTDVCVIGLFDTHWGQVVTAIYVPSNSTIFNENIKALLQEKLSNYKIPKFWISVDSLPRNSQGKINRQKLYEIAAFTELSIQTKISRYKKTNI
ncbi:MAG: 2-succinylbenzoate--CoA ligase [Nostocales cyanobacterium 94392]|nr:2-succinylbenzoate--CoA ligase [Nostocales cyanobacterium 94392]